MKVGARRLKGFPDYNPSVMAKRVELIHKFRDVASLAGFVEVDTPALEYADVLLGVGGETDKQVFRFDDNGGRDIGLRYDLTVPFARYVSEHFGEISLPFRRMQLGKVWRAEKPQRGRFREFMQCDLDIIGTTSIRADAEIITTFTQIFNRFNLGDFTIRVGHRGLLSAVVEDVFSPDDSETEQKILIALDKWDKIGPEGVRAILLKIGFIDKNIDAFFEFFAQKYSLPDGLDELQSKLPESPAIAAALSELGGLFALLRHSPSVEFDQKIVRGLGYYTGVVFETLLKDHQDLGSICSGGRYDHLASRFSNQELSGIGASLGLDRLLAAIADAEAPPPCVSSFVIPMAPEQEAYAMEVCQLLRRDGLSCEMSLKNQKLGHQMKSAAKKGYTWTLIIGDREEVERSVTVKHMKSGEQISMPIGNLMNHISSS